MLFSYPGFNTNHDKINQVRKTKHPYLLTLPLLSLHYSKHNRAYKLTLYLPSNSQKMNEKFGDVKKKKKLIKHGGGKKFTLRLPIEREIPVLA
jgi:polysaccharide deacetylase 2 family uncharacterized protein YibQ